MIGPAHGHNIKPFLDFFNINQNYELTFAYNSEDEYSSNYKNIKFVPFSFNPFSIIRFINVIRKPNHLIWHHGGYSIGILFLINLFHPRKTAVNINIWGPVLLQWAVKKNIKGFLYRKFLKKADIIQCNWYGTKKQIDEFNDESKSIVLPGGIEKSFFVNSNEPISEFAQDFINQIPKKKTIFFYPKSIIPQTCHKEIVEGANELVKKGVKNFIIYFWLGNLHNQSEIDRIKDMIAAYSLDDQVKIVFHGFLPFVDIKTIWEHMDVGFMLVDDDQLSTALLEPLMMKKELIASDIYPFKILGEKYPELELKLIENTPLKIAHRMEDFIDGNKTSETVLENRKKVIEKEFNFEKNIQKMLDYYQLLLKR